MTISPREPRISWISRECSDLSRPLQICCWPGYGLGTTLLFGVTDGSHEE